LCTGRGRIEINTAKTNSQVSMLSIRILCTTCTLWNYWKEEIITTKMVQKLQRVRSTVVLGNDCGWKIINEYIITI